MTKAYNYSGLVSKLKPGDGIIFINKGVPFLVAEATTPVSEGATISFPEGDRYENSFNVKICSFGSITRQARDELDLLLPRGVCAESDEYTFEMLRTFFEQQRKRCR